VTTFLISSERRDLAQFFVNSLGWLPFAVACITFPLWYWTASHMTSIRGAFFEVGAQVIPVILLATTLEVRLSRTLETSDLAVTIAILLGGEILALYGAAIGDVSHVGFTAAWRYAVVSAALSSGFFTLIMGVIADYDPKPVRRPPPQRRPDPKLLPLAARRSRRNR
jgi:hypothetical protein